MTMLSLRSVVLLVALLSTKAAGEVAVASTTIASRRTSSCLLLHRPSRPFHVATRLLRAGGDAYLDEEEEEDYKSKEDWWKDPLAMFDDDDEEHSMKNSASAVVARTPIRSRIMGSRFARPKRQRFDDGEEEENDSSGMDSVMEANITTESTAHQNNDAMEEDEFMMLEENVDFALVGKPKVESQKKRKKKKKSKNDRKKNKSPDRSKWGVVRASNQSRSRGTSLTAPLATSLTQFQSVLESTPVVKVLVAAVFVRLAVGSVLAQVEKRKHTVHKNTVADDEVSDDMEYADDAEEKIAYTDVAEEEVDDDEYAEEELDEQPLPMFTTAPKGLFRWIKRLSGPTGVGRRAMRRELEELRLDVKAFEKEREATEREYESASRQLQETQAELATLSTTTRYLKAQLRDNEQAMERTIRAERSKAKAELTKMKDAMLRVLEKERTSMREELKRRTNELQALMDASNYDEGIEM